MLIALDFFDNLDLEADLLLDPDLFDLLEVLDL